ncbi:MAG: Ig-like domain-containing protein [Lachnospiraceae bacterium]|nr:Ig-like domain-containing protein [Lachnospiraceae bacterium]
MKKSLRRIISSVLAAVIAVTMIRVPVYATEIEEESYQYRSDGIRFVPGFAPAPHEDEYESVNMDPSADQFFGAEEDFFVSPIATRKPSREQGRFGTCWSFATMAAAEMSAANYGTQLRDGSYANEGTDLSELHLAYFAGKKIEPYDPLGGFAGDRNGTKKNFLDNGGSAGTATQLLANWIGTADENDYKYAIDKSLYSYETDRENGIDDVMHLRGFYFANPKNDPDAVKKLIKDYGAVVAVYYDEDGIYCRDNNCYYLSYNPGTNHVIALVGWNDNFSRENFTNGAQPEGDGAWLVRNSWEAGNYVNEKGELTGEHAAYNSYFWLSYYDQSLWTGAYAVDMDRVNTYDHNYQYDGCMTGGYLWGQKKYANIFTASDDSVQQLSAVFFSTHSANVDYKIDVYTGVSEGDPESGTCALSGQSGKTSYAGGYTIELERPVDLEPGESFSVVITVPQETYMDAEESSSGYYETVAHTEGSRSLCWFGDKWMTASQRLKDSAWGDFRIKAFTKNGSAGPVAVKGVSLPKSKSVKAGGTFTLTPTVEPSYATDKSVTWSSSNDTVASVDVNGTVTAVGKGTTDITVTTVDGGFTDVCRVTVTDDSDLVLIPGEVRRLYLAEYELYAFGLKWNVESAEPKNCVSVSNGIVTAKNLPKGKTTGEAVVTATNSSNVYRFNIKVDGTAHGNVPIIDGGKKIQLTAPKTINLTVGKDGKADLGIPVNLRSKTAGVDYGIYTEGICSVSGPTYNKAGSKAAFAITPVNAGATYIEWSMKDAKGNETKAYTKVIVKKPIDGDNFEVSCDTALTVGQGTWIGVVADKDNTDSNNLTFGVKGKGIKVSKTGHVIATEPGAKGTITVKAGKASKTIDVAADSPEKYMTLKQTSVTVTAPKPGAKAKTTAISIAVPKKRQDQPEVIWSLDWNVPGVGIDEKSGVVSVTDAASPGIYQVVATPSDPDSGYNAATCELIVK